MTTFFIIAISILTVAYFLFLVFCLLGWNKTAIVYHSHQQPNIKVSIVIAARNEDNNIKSCIEAALQQNYPSNLLQVIVVDDDSTDDTLAIAKSLQNQYANLIVEKSKLINQHTTSYKKHALQQGIDLANGTLIVTHDADCVAQKEWISTLVNCYNTTQAKVIAMPITYEKAKGKLYDFQQQDLCGLMTITAGSLYFNMPLMANAANMAFEKSVFNQVNGFAGNEHVPGGDDIYLLLKIKNAYSAKAICFLKDAKAIVTTKPCNNFHDFFQQRVRWASKSGKFNNFFISTILLLSYLFNCGLLLALVIAVSFLNFYLFVACSVVYLLKWILEYRLVSSGAQLLHYRFTPFQFLLCNVLHQVYVIIFGLLALFIPYKWKDRKY